MRNPDKHPPYESARIWVRIPAAAPVGFWPTGVVKQVLNRTMHEMVKLAG
jgi:hypothetical protein